MKRMRWLPKIARTVVVVLFFACVGLALRSVPLHEGDGLENQSRSPMRWVQLIDETALPVMSIHDVAQGRAGEPLVLETTLHDIQDGARLLFRSKNQEVRVFVGNREIYHFLMQKDFAFLDTPGNTWNEIDLVPSMNGATLRVELTAQTDYFSTLFYDLYLTSQTQIDFIKVQHLWLQVLTGAFLLVIAIISYVNAGIWRGTQTQRYVVHLADFYLVLALFILGKAGAFNLIFHRPLISFIVEMLTLRMVPIVAYHFILTVLRHRYRMVTAMGWCSWSCFFLSVVLQFSCGVSFLETIWLAHALLLLGVAYNVFMCLRHLYQTRHDANERNYLFLGSFFLFVSALFEIGRFYYWPKSGDFIGLCILIGSLIYTLIAHVVLVYRNAVLDRGSTAMQTRYNKLQNTTLMRQINAHFFFNTLNTISALCKEDAAKADEAVTALAKYMRYYMYLIRTETNILLEQELDLVRVYLAIEQMRFEEAFAVTWDISFSNFELPPLAIQPLVENAMVHGLRGRHQFGHLRISSKKAGAYAVITIEDDGVGFDVNVLENKESLALDNIRTRLATMADGTLEVTSVEGQGTCATVRIPLQSDK